MKEPPIGPDPGTGSGNLIGTCVGRYRILAPIGRGGQGEVYLAEDPRLFRRVALKKLPPEFSRNRLARKRAIEEAVRASRMSDPHLAEVFDIVESDGDVTLVMEYVEGERLRERITRGISLEEFWDIAFQCVEALEAAHRGGLLHRDIKPENIMITPKGQVKILDFGLAKRLPLPEELASMTTQSLTPNAVSGTPPYMSPEAHLNQDLDARSDLFSLGVVFYEMLTGRRPFRGNLAEVIDGILRSRPDPPGTVREGIPASLDHVVMKLLGRDREWRYASAADLLKDMAAAQRGELAVEIPTVPLPAPVLNPFAWTRFALPRLRWILGGVLTLAAVSLAVPDVRFQLKRTLGMSVLPPRVSAAVLPYEGSGGDADMADFTRGLNQLVNRRLNRVGAECGVYVAPSRDVARYDVISPEAARAKLGVTVALRTRMRFSGAEVMGEVEMLDADRGRVLGRKEIRLRWSDPTELAHALTRGSAALLGMDEALDGGAEAWRGGIGPGTFRFYLEGLGALAEETDSVSVMRAAEGFERAISITPEFADACVGLGRARFALFEITQEESWLERTGEAAALALARDSTLATAHYLEGCVLGARAQWEAAAGEFETVIALDPAYRSAYYLLAEAYEELGRPDGAEESYKAAVAALPLDYHCYWSLGAFYFNRGQDEEGLDAFRRMTLAAPDLSRGYAGYGGLLVQKGRYREGISALKRSISLNPVDSAYSNLATAQFQLRNFDEAISAYREAISLGYENHRMWYNLGDAFFWAPGKRELSREPYTRAIDLAEAELIEDPDDLYTLCEMADMLPKVGRGEEARACMERALAVSADNSRILYWAALVAWQLGERSTALDRLEQAVDAGYSVLWLRDSPIFDAWRSEERFMKLLDGHASA